MYLTKIDKTIDGFPNTNNFKITLNKTLNNISVLIC